jgi:carbonic anhydrase
MKKDFFGGGEETETIFNYCGEICRRDPAACEGCRRPSLPDDDYGIAAAADSSGSVVALPADWGYRPDNGPHTWHKLFPVAVAGRFQSPVDLRECDLRSRRSLTLPPLLTCFQPAAGLLVENTGASWQISWPKDDPVTACQVRGGPLTGEYRLLQLHAHWGAVPGRGSEHTLEGRSYDAELHLVFYNAKYEPEEAMEAPDGLAVIGMFLQQEDNARCAPHAELDKITRRLGAVRHRSLSTSLEEPLNPGGLLPVSGRAYFTYPGSLTAPPLYESVTWIVMREPVRVLAHQLDMMRGMLSGSDDESSPLVDNFRPTCCLDRRPLKAGN